MPTLLIETVENKEKKTFAKYISIGRSSKCGISIKDIKLSRVHCEILLDENDFLLIDLNSQNGTCLNGKPITEIILSHEDVMTIGKTKITYFAEEQKEKTDKELLGYKPIKIKKIGKKDLEGDNSAYKD